MPVLLMQTRLCKALTEVPALLLLWVMLGPQAGQHFSELPGHLRVGQPKVATSVIISEAVVAAGRLRMGATVGIAGSVQPTWRKFLAKPCSK